MSDHDSLFKHVLDGISTFVAVGAVAKILPDVSALVSIVWFGIRIWESDTVRGWTNRNKPSKHYIDTDEFRRYRERQ